MISLFCLIFGFAFVWHIWWLVIASFAGVIGAWVAYSFQRNKDYYVDVADVKTIEDRHLQQVYKARPEYYQKYVKTSNQQGGNSYE